MSAKNPEGSIDCLTLAHFVGDVIDLLVLMGTPQTRKQFAGEEALITRAHGACVQSL